MLVPTESLSTDPPPTFPVFFNPAASLNRDVSVAITSATSGETFCDSMAGVGARGLRIAREVNRVGKVTLVDFNGRALKLARRSATLNRVVRKCEFTIAETTSFLYSRYGSDQSFDYVDVDPFGTPCRQFQASVSATADSGILSATATDTAVLCGVYPEVSRRRYGALSLNNHFHHESGARILVGCLAREAARLDAGVEPVAAHSTRHYIRVFVRVKAGAARADDSLAQLGYIIWCPTCEHVSSSFEPGRRCEDCGGRVKCAGPLWLGPLADDKVGKLAEQAASANGLTGASKIMGSLRGINSFQPWSFSIERVCSSLKIATVPESRVHNALKEIGHKAMRTPFERTGVKTDASYPELVSAVRSTLLTRVLGEARNR